MAVDMGVLVAMVEQHAKRMASIETAVTGLLTFDKLAGADMGVFDAAEAIIGGGADAAVSVSEAHYSMILEELTGVAPKPLPVAVDSWVTRAARQVTAAVAKVEADPLSPALRMAVTLSADVLHESGLLAADRTMSRARHVVAYRRVVHPEVSIGGACGLCASAATRLYRKHRLRRLHGRCRCTVLPVTNDVDPGDVLNLQDLPNLYELAGGSTDRGDLARVRVGAR